MTIEWKDLSPVQQVEVSNAMSTRDPGRVMLAVQRVVDAVVRDEMVQDGSTNILDAHEGRIARLEALKENFESLQGYCERLATEFDAAAVRTNRQVADLETQVQRAVEQLRTATLAKMKTQEAAK